MSTTEIPNDLLIEAMNVLPHLGYKFEQAEFCGEVQMKVDEAQMHRLLPLIKWLEYIDATWNAEMVRQAVGD